jgi:two-component system sensor histidine kinase GlrK
MLLMSVLDNLYSNAVHYGTESGNIYIRSYTNGSRVFIDVANTGTPIPMTKKHDFRTLFPGESSAKRCG